VFPRPPSWLTQATARSTTSAKKLGVLGRKIAEFGAINLEGDVEPRKVEAFAQRTSDLHESITQLQKEVDELKAQRKPPHATFRSRTCPKRRASIA
jgi:hypothetical protein